MMNGDDEKFANPEAENDGPVRERRMIIRRQSDPWRPTNGFFAKAAAGVAAIAFLVVFVMNILGWRFTGNSADIKANTSDIAALKIIATANQAAIAANTQAIAAAVANGVIQARDIADLKSSLASLMFVSCQSYQKLYEGSPTLSECLKTITR